MGFITPRSIRPITSTADAGVRRTLAARRTALLAIGAAVVLIGRSAVVLGHEMTVRAAEDRLATYELTLGRTGAGPDPSAMGPGAPPRAQLAEALLLARQAVAGPRNEAQLNRAGEAVNAAVSSRRRWGEAWAVKAYVEALRSGDRSPAAIEAFGRSYDDAPFLQSAAQWRVQYGLSHWDDLGAGLRERVLQEALWLAHTDSSSRDALFVMARGTPMYEPLMLGWRILRRREVAQSGVSPAP